jgi:hypothetical protein
MTRRMLVGVLASSRCQRIIRSGVTPRSRSRRTLRGASTSPASRGAWRRNGGERRQVSRCTTSWIEPLATDLQPCVIDLPLPSERSSMTISIFSTNDDQHWRAGARRESHDGKIHRGITSRFAWLRRICR